MATEAARHVTEGGVAAEAVAFALGRSFGEHAAEINRLYNTYTGRTRSLQAYEWEWHAGPDGPGFVWTITEVATGRLVGHHGIVRTPMVRRGIRLVGGRTENTIVEPGVRRKLFYVAMEKRALTEALQTFDVLYTVLASGAHAKVRARLGYTVVGRWVAYLLRCRSVYLAAVLLKLRQGLALKVPSAVFRIAASLGAVAFGIGRGSSALDVEEIADITLVRDEYEGFWCRARQSYPLTIDRSFEFLRWRIVDNPYIPYRTWALRRDGRLQAVVIAHQRAVGTASSLEVDDIIVSEYSDAAFDAVIGAMSALDPASDAIVVRTLALDTPLHRVLRRRLPNQGFFVQRWGERFFEDFVAHDRNGVAGGRPWYVTPLFTEGSRAGVHAEVQSAIAR